MTVPDHHPLPSALPAKAAAYAGAIAGADADLLPIFAGVWLASAARVVGAVCLHESFGAEATLALAAFAVIPWLVGDSVRAALRRARNRPGV